jgi:F0F1-type ATP synthase membrane subunit a
MNLLFLLARPTLAVNPFWNTAIGIFVVIVLVLIAILAGGLAFALRAQKKTEQLSQAAPSVSVGPILSFLKDLFGDFTNVLAWLVILLAFISIFLICNVALKDKSADTAKYVFGAVLPLLGTWVGAVLAHYFQKENLAAANQSITDLAAKVVSTDKLSTPRSRPL